MIRSSNCFSTSLNRAVRGYNRLGTDAWGPCGTLSQGDRSGGVEVLEGVERSFSAVLVPMEVWG